MKLVTDYGKPWFTLRNLHQYMNTTSSEPVTLGSENLFFLSLPDLVSLLLLILLSVLLGPLEDLDSPCLPRNLSLDRVLGAVSSVLRLALAALQDRLWDGRQFVRHFDF